MSHCNQQATSHLSRKGQMDVGCWQCKKNYFIIHMYMLTEQRLPQCEPLSQKLQLCISNGFAFEVVGAIATTSYCSTCGKGPASCGCRKPLPQSVVTPQTSANYVLPSLTGPFCTSTTDIIHVGMQQIFKRFLCHVIFQLCHVLRDGQNKQVKRAKSMILLVTFVIYDKTDMTDIRDKHNGPSLISI